MVTIEPRAWAQEVFGKCTLGDVRRERRLKLIASGLAEHSGKSLVSACGLNAAELEGTYRFVENKHVEGEAIREGGFESVKARVGDFDVLLAAEDTTTLSYSHAPVGTGELGGPSGTKSRGFWVHSSLLIDPQTSMTVGLLDQQWWVRPERVEVENKAGKQAYKARESFKWQRCSEAMEARLGPDMSRVISVCDREADIFEYLHYKSIREQRFVVRSSSNRRLIGEYEERLEEEVDSWWPKHQREVEVPQRGGRKSRKISVQIAAGTLELRVPSGRAETLDTIKLNVVQAYELNAPEGEEPLHWRLYTSEPIEATEQIDFILKAYALRWRVEDFHKAWKTGCKAEALRLRSAENLERAASVLAFVAVRLLRLRERTEREPEAPCTALLEDDEWRCLWVSVEKTRPPSQPPTMLWAHIAIARLAGWYGSKKKSRVGWQKYWQGYSRFQDLLSGWRLAQAMREM